VVLLVCPLSLLLLLLLVAAGSAGSMLLHDLEAPASPCKASTYTAPAAAMLLLQLLQGCLLLCGLRCAAHCKLERHLRYKKPAREARDSWCSMSRAGQACCVVHGYKRS
jgi:hypothetical protein